MFDRITSLHTLATEFADLIQQANHFAGLSKEIIILRKSQHIFRSIQSIENIYSELVNSLLSASNEVVPLKQASSVKNHWLDNSLKILKTKSIVSHSDWVKAGRPRSGNLY